MSLCYIDDKALDKLNRSKGRKLLISRPKMRESIYNRIVINNIAEEYGHHYEKIIYPDSFDRKMISELCVQIFVQKQKDLIN